MGLAQGSAADPNIDFKPEAYPIPTPSLDVDSGSDEREGGTWTGADRYGDIDADEDGEPGPAAAAFEGEDEDVNEVRRWGSRRTVRTSPTAHCELHGALRAC